MKPLLIITIAALPLMEYGKPAQESEATPVPQTEIQKPQQAEEAKTPKPIATESAKPPIPPKTVSANEGSDPAREVKPEPSTAKVEESEVSIHEAAWEGNIKAVEQHITHTTTENNAQDAIKYQIRYLGFQAGTGQPPFHGPVLCLMYSIPKKMRLC